MPKRSVYLDYIRQAYRNDLPRLEEEVARWRRQYDPNSPLFGYTPTRYPLSVAVVAAFLYEQDGDPALAQTAKENLLCFREFTKIYPEEAARERPEYKDGIPPLDNVFDPIQFAPTCERIRQAVTAEEYDLLAGIMADSLRPTWLFPEWGGHNRTMLRAASLALCARAFPSHPAAPDWVSLADELAEESWGRWSIEDAMMYQSHWLRSMILYAEARGKSAEMEQFLPARHHIRAMPQLMSPLGVLPDFGDSHWLMHSPWEWLAVMEWGAKTYGDSSMKWAVERIWEAQGSETPNLYAATVLTLAYRWMDDSIPAAPPSPTPDALDDLVIKKLVFRTGWDKKASYACVNYRDEGDYGKIARDYLRTNLAVSAEKMHHGHSDEGSFVLLIHGGSILLHESGYRESPPDGKYRADLYHNRLVWRERASLPEESAMDVLRDNGHYKPVRTQRLYQTHLLDVQFSRIRTRDEVNGLEWDRSIVFLPEMPCWVVVDSAFALRNHPRTFSCLWWTTDILNQDVDWYETQIKNIQSWKNSDHAHLRILLPDVPGQTLARTVTPMRRCFQDEQLITTTWSGMHLAGRAINFVSVLFPQTEGAEIPSVRVLPTSPYGRGIGVRLSWGGEERRFGLLNDLSCGWLQEEIRPRYTAEAGWTVYQDSEEQKDALGSDAALAYSISHQGRLERAGFINGTRLEFVGKRLYDGVAHAMFQENRTAVPGVPARFRWEMGTKG